MPIIKGSLILVFQAAVTNFESDNVESIPHSFHS